MSAFIAPVPLPRLAPVRTSFPVAPPRRARAAFACAASPPSLREAYKSAKAAYKSAKRAGVPLPPARLARLERDYRAAKARYKSSAKRPKTPDRSVVTLEDDGQGKEECQVGVCGGNACKRLGADAVAAMMRLPPPGEKCMKLCGGVGPTLVVDGVPRKVDFRKALADAVHVEQTQYQNN